MHDVPINLILGYLYASKTSKVVSR